ncbi:MAG: alpha/beta hydrolase [Tetrasphaera sp.]
MPSGSPTDNDRWVNQPRAALRELAAANELGFSRFFAADLGNAVLLTYDADQHGALTDLSRCVFGHVVAYVNDLTLPPAGQACVQEYPAFPAPEARRTPPPQWGPGSPAVHR